MKILVIDPWGIKSIAHYLNGLCFGLSKFDELTLITNYYHKEKQEEFTTKKWFFKISEKCSIGKLRLIIRGIEYFWTWIKILLYISRQKFDIIQVEWFLFYKIDKFFVKRAKKYGIFIYKAHNVIPHENGERYKKDLNTIYREADYIVIHGNAVLNEFREMFPEINTDKIIIQHHGTYDGKTKDIDINAVDKKIVNRINSFAKRYIFFGSLYYNKGVDRLIDIWNVVNIPDTLLIIAGGSTNSEYKTLLEEKVRNSKSEILLIDRYVDENTLNYLISSSQIVLITYRHASMSGVLFTAAEFKKTVLCTDVGCLKEYYLPGINGFLCHNANKEIEKALLEVSDYTIEELSGFGEAFGKYIKENYSWQTICNNLHDRYKKIIGEE